MMHICHFSTLTSIGGIERLLIDFLYHPTHHGSFFYHLVTTSSDPELIKQLPKSIGWYQPQARFRYNPQKLFEISQYLRRHHIKLIHSYNAYANAWAGLALLRSHLPHICHEHGSIWSIGGIIRWLDQFSQQRASLVLANSHASALMLQKRYGLAKSKIRVIYNGVRELEPLSKDDARRRLGLPTDIKVVGSVGRLNTPKDFWTFIDTAKLIAEKRKDVLFVIVGGGPQETFLKNLIKNYGLEKQFVMTGKTLGASDWIAAFDLFISTSIYESFGNVLVEAAYLQKPVIAPATNGCAEIVVNEETGILLKPTRPIRKVNVPGASAYPKWVVQEGKFVKPRSLDPEILAETVISLLDDPKKCETMGKRARERARELFSLERYIRDIEDVYLDLLGYE